MKSARFLRELRLRRGQNDARRWALFFYRAMSGVGLFFLVATVSCSGVTPGPEKSAASTSNMGEAREAPISGTDQEMEQLETELERARLENDFLREENGLLRAEIVRLNWTLAEANEKIYSLNRKLDAIFKPEIEKDQSGSDM